MDSRTVLHAVMQVAGAAIMLLVIADVFVTVLYARLGTSLLSDRIARLTWRAFRWAAALVPSRSGTVLSFGGPAVMIIAIGFWTTGLTLGAALIIYPALGTGVRSSSGGEPPPHDFVTATYAAGNSVSIVGAGGFSPATRGFRLFYLFNSLVGTSLISLTLTYVMQVYSALQQRNAAALKVHLATGESGDAAELIAAACPQGDDDDATSELSQMASTVAQVKETHHFYSALTYFRFREPYYAVARLTLVALDTVCLVRSAMDERRYAKLKRSGALSRLHEASMRLLTGVATVAPSGRDDGSERRQPDAADEARWRLRYAAAIHRLREAGVGTAADERGGADAYVAMRAEWDCHVRALAGHMGYEPDEVDPAGVAPARAPGRDGAPLTPYRRLNLKQSP